MCLQERWLCASVGSSSRQTTDWANQLYIRATLESLKGRPQNSLRLILRVAEAPRNFKLLIGLCAEGLKVGGRAWEIDVVLRRLSASLAIILVCPVSVRRASSIEPVVVPLESLRRYEEALVAAGFELGRQGVLIETLHGGRVLGQLNPDSDFNPASVMKLATSLAALIRFGPNHRYRTDFLADGRLQVGLLRGDLVVIGGYDPLFSEREAEKVAAELRRLGIERVAGSLRVSGPFYYFVAGERAVLTREASARQLLRALRRFGLRIGRVRLGGGGGSLLFSHNSQELVRILLYQNAHSSNPVAEVIGESLGGTAAIGELLARQVGLGPEQIRVGSASGLGFSRMTPRAALKLLRALEKFLYRHWLKLEDLMPVAGIDSGTLRERFSEMRASIVAKTGTLGRFEGGASALAGLAYTRRRGPVLFVIFNSGGDVSTFRRLQDDFLSNLIQEEGGPAQILRTTDALAAGP
jgi:D-alanyl-D-alanine carboxypeptidase/D-alanyl-D-alanine-endopeptidase (penicillin-binding protein 4)